MALQWLLWPTGHYNRHVMIVIQDCPICHAFLFYQWFVYVKHCCKFCFFYWCV